MRGWNFPKVAPSNGLAYGVGAAQGLSSAVQNYAKMRLQHQQMQYMNSYRQQMAQANLAWRTAQLEGARRKNQDSNMAKIQLGAALLKSQGKTNPEMAPLIKSAIKKPLDDLVSNMSPDEANALRIKVEQEANRGIIDPQFSGELNNFNATEKDAMTRLAGIDAKSQNVKTTVAGGIKRAQIAAGSRVDVANINAEGKPDLQAQKDIAAQMRATSNQLSNLDKPPPPGALPLDEPTKAPIRKALQDNLVNLHQKYDEILSRSRDDDPAAAGAPAAPKAPRYLPKDQASQAGVGDFVPDPGGQGYRKVVQGPDGALHADMSAMVPAPDATPAPPAAAPPASSSMPPSSDIWGQ